jgi:hypothetical protein
MRTNGAGQGPKGSLSGSGACRAGHCGYLLWICRRRLVQPGQAVGLQHAHGRGLVQQRAGAFRFDPTSPVQVTGTFKYAVILAWKSALVDVSLPNSARIAFLGRSPVWVFGFPLQALHAPRPQPVGVERYELKPQALHAPPDHRALGGIPAVWPVGALPRNISSSTRKPFAAAITGPLRTAAKRTWPRRTAFSRARARPN